MGESTGEYIVTREGGVWNSHCYSFKRGDVITAGTAGWPRPRIKWFLKEGWIKEHVVEPAPIDVAYEGGDGLGEPLVEGLSEFGGFESLCAPTPAPVEARSKSWLKKNKAKK